MSVSSYAVAFRGHLACPCQVAWIPAFEHEAQRRGILTGPAPISQMIGGAPQSGGTHTDGGADDTYPLTTINDVDAYVWLSRQMGADGTWHRPEDWDHEDGVEHVHRVLRGCPHNGPARYQYDSPSYGVDHGHNGLASGALDDGPRPLSRRTWRQGIEWAKQQEENDMALSDDDKAWIADTIKTTVNQAVSDGLKAEQANGRTIKNNILKIAQKLGVEPAKD